MMTFAVNKNNDLYIDETGNLAIISGIDAVMQTCEQAAKTLRGEMLLEINRGIPMFETAFNGVPNLIQYEAALRKIWREIPEVKDITNLDIRVSDNTLSYSATIQTVNGQGAVNGEL